MKKLIIVTVVTTSTISILMGCGRSGAKKPFEFLKSEREILNDTNLQLNKYSNQNHTIPPLVREDEMLISDREQEDVKAYRVARAQYFGAVIQYSQQVEKSVNEAELQISKLDSSGIEDDAVNLTKDYGTDAGDQIQVCGEVRALLGIAETRLQENKQAEMNYRLGQGVITIIESTLVSGGF